MLGKYQLSVKQFFAIYGLALGTLILVALALSGRLHPIAAALGVALTMGARLLPWIMRGLQAMNLLRAVGAMRNAQSAHRGPRDGATSEVISEFLSMKLDHDAGSIDGQVLKGSFEGARLSALGLEDLLQRLIARGFSTKSFSSKSSSTKNFRTKSFIAKSSGQKITVLNAQLTNNRRVVRGAL